MSRPALCLAVLLVLCVSSLSLGSPVRPVERVDYLSSLPAIADDSTWWSVCVREADSASAFSLTRDVANSWTGRDAPFALNTVPERNPVHACLFSPSYRAAHASLCADVRVESLDAAGAAPVPAPFASNVSFELVRGRDTSCAAYGWFSEELLNPNSGWNTLFVETNAALSDAVQARAAGFLEGALTVRPIHEHKINEWFVLFGANGTGPDARVQAFLSDTTTFQLQQVDAHAASDPYWAQAGNMLQQLQGIWEGFTALNNNPDWQMSFNDFLMLQNDAEMSDIQAAVQPELRIDPASAPLPKVMEFLERNGHCSALIKLTSPEPAANATLLPELFAAHDTWNGFSSTHRMYKVYNLSYSHVASTVISLTSYPAFLTSADDFLQTLESRLVVLETTNDVVNGTLFELVDSASNPTWMRSVVATRLAHSGAEWANFFGKFNSGTYNNQWMIVDFKLFTAGAPLQPGTLWIAEQLPVQLYSEDVTSVLQEYGYWASYNQPYNSAAYDLMGYAVLNATWGAQFPYLFDQAGPHSMNFRAQLYRREQSSILTLADMQRVQTLNEWQTDPLSHNNSGLAIAARFDLSPVSTMPLGWFNRSARGMYDSKITCSAWMHNVVNSSLSLAGESLVMRVSLINSPTYAEQKPFSWLEPEWANSAPHVGLPDVYAFPYIQMAVVPHAGPTPPPGPPPPSDPCAALHCSASQICHRAGSGKYSCIASPGKVAGIIIGIVLGIVALMAVAYLVRRRRRQAAQWESNRDSLIITQRDAEAAAAAAQYGYQSNRE